MGIAASPGRFEVGSGDVTLGGFVAAVDGGAEIVVAEGTVAAVEENGRYLEALAATQTVYGANTGFGPMAGHRIDPADRAATQQNLIRSHAVGQGEPIADRFIRATMLARLIAVSRGLSGVSAAPARALAEFLNAGILPLVPERGSVGASGDLVQLAHVALGLTGEGRCRFRGATVPVAEAIAETGVTPLALSGREGLALVNGTSAMTGIAACVAADAARAVGAATVLSAWLYEIVGASSEYLSAEIHDARPHPGQTETARAMREILSGSTRLQGKPAETSGGDYRSVQHVYSVRCVPQVLGPVLESVRRAAETIETELRSTTDNPITVTGVGVFHGGNFHGDYVAAAADALKLGLAKLGLLVERQLALLLDPDQNRLALPPFLNLGKLGVDLGLQGLQFVATSTAARNQTLAFPASLHTIPTNNGNQDIVSMGADAAVIAAKVVDGTLRILAIEAIALARATAILGIEGSLAPRVRAAHEAVARAGLTGSDRFSAETVAAVDGVVRADPALAVDCACR
jgi:histidine ammonia-lyase